MSTIIHNKLPQAFASSSLAIAVATLASVSGSTLLAPSAQALSLNFGSGGTEGPATLVTPDVNSHLIFLAPDSAHVSQGKGQFATEGGVFADIVGAPTSFNLIGGPGAYATPAVANFLTIKRADGKTVTVDLLPGSGTSFVAGTNFAYNLFNLPAIFNEPAGDPNSTLNGFVTINASSSTGGGVTSQTYQITLAKNSSAIPEPSAVLSLLALGGLGLVSLKRKHS
jgi:hypothetical protein